jgi:RNA polymerase sigma factor (sigma-70 family)
LVRGGTRRAGGVRTVSEPRMSTVAPLRLPVPPSASPAAWRERSGRLYSQFRRPATGMIRRAFRNAFEDDEIEDIYSNAWLGTLRALERRQHELSDEEIRKYLLTAVANHATKELRRRKRRPTASLDAIHAVADTEIPPDERASKLEESRVTRDLLSSLPPRRRAVMLLRYGWGLEPQQVCGLIKGLSPRAYRKEITRGVDELTEKIRLLEEGEWCADREPVLKAYAAGHADPDQERQAQQHLAHCRHCGEFVGRLAGHLHDAGGSLALFGAIDDRHLSIASRLGEMVQRIRESAPSLADRSSAASQDGPAQAFTASGGARGAGVAGVGWLAKIAGLGGAGKLAALCLGGGAAATICVASGIVPIQLPSDRHEQPNPAGNPRVLAHEQEMNPAAQVERVPPRLPAEFADTINEQPSHPASPTVERSDPGPEQTTVPAPEPAPPPSSPVAPPAPVQQHEFGTASAAAPSSFANESAAWSSAGSTSGGGGNTVQDEFDRPWRTLEGRTPMLSPG